MIRAPGQEYLFDSLGSTSPNSSRKVHIRRLVDLLELCIHRRDWPRAKRAWAVLTRCPEFEWQKMWQTGLLLATSLDDALDIDNADPRRLDYLRVMMLRCPENRVSILQELLLQLINGGQHREALDELELYLPSFPFQDNAVLHMYAGLLYLFLADLHISHENASSHATGKAPTLNPQYLRECKTHLRRASELDPSHPVPTSLLQHLQRKAAGNVHQDNANESDDGSEFISDGEGADTESKK
ncbi:hypothetical protein BU17DRAFT_100226 [Hysterangium stoloniferum]|nr:hypothetical protein BU17DRAFT_100226 [Hysterangium stoloniferum]